MSEENSPKREENPNWVQFTESNDGDDSAPSEASENQESQIEVPGKNDDENLNESETKYKTTNWVKFEEESPSNRENHVKTNDFGKTTTVAEIENDKIQLNSSAQAPNYSNQSNTVKKTDSHPLNNSNVSSHTDADPGSVAVDMSVTCTQHSAVDSRPSTDWNSSRRNQAITQGFSNGDVIVSVLPLNNKCPWITKAEFRPELVPEELMAQGLTLTVEDYVQAMKILVSDFRFNLFIICYKRILIVWILIGFIFLISFLFSGLRGIVLFICGIVWLILNAIGIFFCMWFKIKLNRGLEYCMAEVNSFLFKQKVILALDDRGKLSCHKVNLIFLYFDVTDCLKYLNEMLNREERLKEAVNATNGKSVDLKKMDIDDRGIVIVGSSNTVLSQHQKRAEKLLLRYMQRWAKDFVRKRLDLNVDVYNEGQDYQPIPPRHCESARCLCQYIEEYLSFKPNGKCSLSKVFSV